MTKHSYISKLNSKILIQSVCPHCRVLAALQGDGPQGMVSPAASFVTAGLSIHGGELGSLHGSADAPAAESQPRSQTQSRPEIRSGSQEAEAEPAPATHAASSAATNAAALSGVSRMIDIEGADAEAGQQDLMWGNGTGSSELGALGITGRSVSSKSGTRRRKVSASLACLHLALALQAC